MSEQRKTVQVYFHWMDVVRKKKNTDETAYSIDEIVQALSTMFPAVVNKDLTTKKHDFTSSKKVVWLDSTENKNNGNFNLVFKSAKYDQSRNVRNTTTMVERGVLKNPEDGDEECTHLCLRRTKNGERFIAVLESNYYGISITNIRDYLNEQFNTLHSESDDEYSYTVSTEILPSEDFLKELEKMKKINLLRITMDIKDLNLGDFQSFADRNEINSTVEIYVRKNKRTVNIPKNLISTAYATHTDVCAAKQITKIAVEGSNDSGCLKIDTNSIQMKHSIEVDTFAPRNEVSTNDFFAKVDNFIKEVLGVQI